MTATAPDTTAPAVDHATVTALLTSLFAGTTLKGAGTTSARAAYQDALYGRAVIVDLRPTPARLADGDLGVDTVLLDPAHPAQGLSQVRRMAEDSAVVLVSTDGVLARRIADHLHSAGLPWVDAVDGGFAAWRAAGLPITAQAA